MGLDAPRIITPKKITFLKIGNNFLRKGGLFIGTTMNGKKVLELLKQEKGNVIRKDKNGGLYYSIE